MLHTLLMPQSGRKAPATQITEAQLEGASSSATPQPLTPVIENIQSEALHLSANMPSNSKSSRKKKAGKSTEPTTTVLSTPKPLLTPKNKKKNDNLKQQKLASVSRPPKSSWFSLGTIWRLLIWYNLYTILFQCPRNPGPSSSTICHVYSRVRDGANPYLQPYYENYFSPYVEKVSPRISHYNEAYFYPAFETASTQYEKYAQPKIQKAKVIVETEYQEKLHPIVAQAYLILNHQYHQHLAPHTRKLYQLYRQAATSPYWRQSRHQAERIYTIYLFPLYKKASPYIHRAYENGRYVTIVVLGPYVKEGARVSGEWFEKNVWHGVSELWKDYVEVQVGRIKDRVNGGNENSSSVPSAGFNHKVDPPAQEESPERKAAREAARKQIEQDLALYTSRFEKHANEVIDSLNAVADGIVTSAMNKQKPIVQEQMRKLDETIYNEMRGLKATIMGLAEHYKPGSSPEESKKNKLEAFDKLFEATSTVGKLIKETAQDIRWESQKFLANVFDEVAAEADTHVEKFDSLIDNGIQELGMKWAWQVEGVTYKDWDRYQDLKKEFSGIKTKVIKAAEKNKRLIEITDWAEGDAWEHGANTRAKEAADELARIKRIAKKKIELNDYSEDFSDKYLTQDSNKAEEGIKAVPDNTPALKSPAGILMAEAKVVIGQQQVLSGDEELWKNTITEKLKDSVEDIKDNVKDAVDHASKAVSEAMYGTKTEKPVTESITSVASDLYNSAWTAASKVLYGTPEPGYMGIATDKYSAAVAAASSVIYGTPTPATESIASAISEKVHEIADKVHSAEVIASEKVYGTPQPLSESIISQAGEVVESAKEYAEENAEAVASAVKESAEAATSVVKENVKAAASVVKENADAASSKVVSMMTPPPAVDNILNAANYRLQEIVDVASEKIYGREKGTFEKATSAVSGAYDSAASKASEAIYGRETGALESAVNMISEAAKSASAEISIAVYGTPKSPFEKATSVVAENVEAATSVIAENVEAATSIVGENLGAAKAAVSEALYGREEEKYYASIVESAGTRLQSMVESASADRKSVV